MRGPYFSRYNSQRADSFYAEVREAREREEARKAARRAKRSELRMARAAWKSMQGTLLV